jgi:hypothetical protein
MRIAHAVPIVVLGLLAGCADDMHKVGVGLAPVGGTPLTPRTNALVISSDEAVKRLAKLLWNTTPDAALVAAGNAAMLKTREDVGAFAQQMLKDARARDGVGAFYRSWLSLDKVPMVVKDPAAFPQWTPDVSADAARETETFAVDVTLDPAGTFTTLMTGGWSYINQRLAALYGVTGVVGTALQKVNLDPNQRGGLLTQASLLALNSPETRTSPTKRGFFVRKNFFCQEVPPPPAIPGNQLPMNLPPNPTARQRLEPLAGESACGLCHVMMDPLGFAYEGFDTIGRIRTTDNGSPVDLTGKVSNGAGTEATFNGPIKLGTILSNFDVVQSCMARRWLAYALGRTVPTSEDGAVAGLATAFKSAGLNIRALIVAVVQSELFLAP